MTVYRDLTFMVKMNLCVLKDLESMFGILDVGLPGLSGLWILERKYMTGVRGVIEMRFLAV